MRPDTDCVNAPPPLCRRPDRIRRHGPEADPLPSPRCRRKARAGFPDPAMAFTSQALPAWPVESIPSRTGKAGGLSAMRPAHRLSPAVRLSVFPHSRRAPRIAVPGRCIPEEVMFLGPDVVFVDLLIGDAGTGCEHQVFKDRPVTPGLRPDVFFQNDFFSVHIA